MKRFVMVLFILPLLVYGQRPPQMGGRAMERLESYKKVRMLEALKLDEEKGLKLVSRYTKYREGVKDLEKERMAVIDALEKSLNGSPTEGEFQKSFLQLNDVERKMSDLRGKYLTDLKEILTERQVAEYLVFERNFARDIRDIVRDVQKERMKKD